MATSFPVNIAQQTLSQLHTGGLTNLQIFKEGWPAETLPYFEEFPEGWTDGVLGNIPNILFAGTLFFADGIYIRTSRPIRLLITTNMFPSGNTLITNDEGFIFGREVDGEIFIPMNIILNSQKEVRITTTEPTTPTRAALTISAWFANPRYVSAGILNTSATKVAYWMGDSITTGKNLPLRNFLCDDFHVFQVENHLNDLLVQNDSPDMVRTVNKAYGGRDVSAFEKWRKNRQLEIDRADVIFYCFGVNEGINNMSASDFTGYLERQFTWKQRRYRDAHMVFVGATPIFDDTQNARIVALRAAELAWVNSMITSGVTNISYCTLANTIDETGRKTLSNYNLSDGVHPGTFAWINAMASAINTHIDNTPDILRALGVTV